MYNYINIVKKVETSVTKLFKILPELSKNQKFWGCACTTAPPSSSPLFQNASGTLCQVPDPTEASDVLKGSQIVVRAHCGT